MDGVERVEVERMGLKKTTKKERGQRNKGRGGEGEKNWELPLPFFKCYMGAGKGRKGREKKEEREGGGSKENEGDSFRLFNGGERVRARARGEIKERGENMKRFGFFLQFYEGCFF